MALTERRVRLKELLLSQGEPLTASQLSEKLGTNERVVRYDLQFVEDALKQEGYLLQKRPGVGIWVERIETDLLPVTAQEYVYSQQERKEIILFLLLNHDHPLTIPELSNTLDVSESTLFEDLRSVQKEATVYQLSLCSKRGIGYWIEGEEAKKRNASVEMFTRFINRVGTLTYFVHSQEDFPYTILYQFFTENVLQQFEPIARILMRIGQKHHIYLYEHALNHLLIYIGIMLYRCREGNVMETISRELEPIREHRYYASMQELREYINNTFEITLPDAEWVYLTVQLLGAKFRHFANMGVPSGDDWELAMQIASEFILYVEARLGMKLEDEELLSSLVLHMKSSLYRLKYEMVLRNPLLSDIKKQYPHIYDVTRNASQYLEQILRKHIPEEEVGFLTIHVGAAIERKKQRRREWKRVAIVCGSGIGTSGLLMATLQSHFPQLEIVNVYTSSSLNQQELDRIDFIITTIHLPNVQKPTLKVSPILTKDELDAIEKQLLYIEKIYADSALGVDGGKLPVLQDVLYSSTIRLDLEAKDWREATRIAGEILVQNEAVEERYVTEMVRNIEQLGPYVVIAPGVALPHARPEEGVHRVCMSLVRLKKAVEFGNPDNDPVKLIFALGGIDHESHLKIISQLVQILDDPTAVDCLMTGNLPQILQIIAHYSNQ
ncbi:transcriptional antiterminator, BglG family [Seinonella peptonophila]|uniref:Transcriptional antiterminator, BglG family n=1 Tax=Seinonella peptonophila TaxID=112248 RepID=A0A1M4W856_9BACL|nr:BglG family transcription antiterminator [Seinonella peptonophila]SHE77406.1 transcriptional antiterminator, BglG family [Seinonella peptonophila]